MSVAFLTTPGCHLCEQALVMIRQVNPTLEFALIDIAESDAMIAQYGERIPVLRKKTANSSEELAWPFGLLDVQAFLAGEV